MAFQAQRGVALAQHFGVHRSMGLMAGGATFANCLVLEDERPALRGVTPPAGVKLSGVLRPSAHDHGALVWIVAVATGYFSFQHRMMAGQVESRPDVQMAAETGIRRFVRVENRVKRAAGLIVQAAWAMTRLATHVRRRVAASL